MNIKNVLDISKEDILLKLFKGFFIFFIIFSIIIFCNRCGSVVYAAENDDRKYFDEYPYWFFWLDKVYASDYPFHFDEDSQMIYTLAGGSKVEFYSFNFGVVKTGSSLHFQVSGVELSYVKSNYEIRNFPGDYDYIVTGDFERIVYNAEYPVLNFGYYTFSAYVPYNDFRFTNDSGLFQIGAWDNSNNRKGFAYSYLGSGRYGSNFIDIGFITDEDILRFYVSSNKDVYYEGVEGLFDSGYLSITNPSLMPNGWTPTFGDSVPPPSISPPGGGGGDESGSILNYINPFSDKFFLKIAFVPSDDFFPGQIERLISSNEYLVHSFDNVISSLETIFSTELGTESFKGIDYGNRKILLGTSKVTCNGSNYDTVFGLSSPAFCAGNHNHDGTIGDLDIAYQYRYKFDLSRFKLLDASYIASFISKFRYYMSGIMSFFFALWLVRWLLSLFGYHMPKGGYTPGSKSD